MLSVNGIFHFSTFYLKGMSIYLILEKTPPLFMHLEENALHQVIVEIEGFQAFEIRIHMEEQGTT